MTSHRNVNDAPNNILSHPPDGEYRLNADTNAWLIAEGSTVCLGTDRKRLNVFHVDIPYAARVNLMQDLQVITEENHCG